MFWDLILTSTEMETDCHEWARSCPNTFVTLQHRLPCRREVEINQYSIHFPIHASEHQILTTDVSVHNFLVADSKEVDSCSKSDKKHEKYTDTLTKNDMPDSLLIVFEIIKKIDRRQLFKHSHTLYHVVTCFQKQSCP